MPVTKSPSVGNNLLQCFLQKFILFEISRHKLESSQTRVFVWFFSKCYSRIYSSFLVSRIFLRIFLKPEQSLVFFLNPPVETLRIAWIKRLESFVKLMNYNSISVEYSQSISLDAAYPRTSSIINHMMRFCYANHFSFQQPTFIYKCMYEYKSFYKKNSVTMY